MLQSPPLHKLVQLGIREGRVTSKGSHHPSTFMGGGDPMVVDHWFRQIEKILEAMQFTSDAVKIILATFQLDGESQVWWH